MRLIIKISITNFYQMNKNNNNQKKYKMNIKLRFQS